MLVAGLAAMALGFVTSFLVLRGSDLTRLMVTLGVALVLRELANRYGWLTGGADGLQGVTIGPVLGMFRFDMFGHTGYTYCLIVLFVLFLIARRLVNSPFGLSLMSVKGNPLRASAIGISVDARLVVIYTVAAGYAGIAGALLAQTTSFASLEVLSFDRSADLLLILIIGGTGYLYGGLIGAIVFKFMQDYLSQLTPQYWPFWIGLVLVVIVLVGRERISSWTAPFRRFVAHLNWRTLKRRLSVSSGERPAP
jgi:branched-chain amino acid transport system permease protein